MTESAPPDSPADEEEEIPKLPRAPLFGKPSLNSVVRIGMIATVLYALIVMRKPCADGVGRFIGGFDEAPAGDAAPAESGDHYPGYQLMTAEEFMKRYPDGGLHDGGAGDTNKLEAAPPDATIDDH